MNPEYLICVFQWIAAKPICWIAFGGIAWAFYRSGVESERAKWRASLDVALERMAKSETHHPIIDETKRIRNAKN